MKPRTPHELHLALNRWQDRMADAAAKIPCEIDGPVPAEVVAELRKIRDRLHQIMHGQDEAGMRAIIADPMATDGQKEWAANGLRSLASKTGG